MADLPNINTADVGIIAFWNAEDHKTAGVVDPLDCTGVFTSYDVYDNGLDGYKALGSGRHFNCRVKNDGWCVAWIDRTNTFGHPDIPVGSFGESGHKGYYDILWNWIAYNANISSTMTTLSYIISLFEAALETSGNFTFNVGDVGHYCYEHTSANVLTILDLKTYVYPSVHCQTYADNTGYIQYTSGTSLYYAAVTAMGYSNNPWLNFDTEAKFESNILKSWNHVHVGASVDLISSGWIPNSLTDYSVYTHVRGTSDENRYVTSSHASIIIMWS